jgi:hypothetical protein
MIHKHYVISCDECTKAKHLLGQSVKECTQEAQNMGWASAKDRKHWYCPDCYRVMLYKEANPEEA